MIAKGEFQINDVLLHIPPEQIHIARQSINHKWQTLRTRSSIKVKSGFSVIDISFTAKFTDTLHGDDYSNGYQQLQDLVAQFRVTPFCYVENQVIRDAVLGSDSTQNMALALKQMEIRKGTGDTNVIEVFFSFSWFNYFPYSRNFYFKHDIFLPDAKQDPRDSYAWKRLTYAARAHYPDVPLLGFPAGSNMLFSFKQFAQLEQGKFAQFQKEATAIQQIEAAQREGVGLTGINLRQEIIAGFGKESGQEFIDLLEDVASSMFDKSNDNVTNEELLAVVSKDDLKAAIDKKYGLPSGGSLAQWRVCFNAKGEVIKSKADPVTLKKEGKENTSKDIVWLERPVSFDLDSKGLIVTNISISFENILATMPLIGHPYPSFQHIGSVDAVITISMMTTDNEAIQALSEFYSMVETQSFKFRGVPQGQRNVVLLNRLVNMLGLEEVIPEGFTVDTVPGQPGTYSAVLQLVDSPIEASRREKFVQTGAFTTNNSIRNEISNILINNLRLIKNPIENSTLWGKIPRDLQGYSKQFNPSTKELLIGGAGVLLAPVTGGYSLLATAGATASAFETKVAPGAETGYYEYAPATGEATDDPRDERFRGLCIEYGRHLGELWKKLYEVLHKEDTFDIAALFDLRNADIFAIEKVQGDLFATSKDRITKITRMASGQYPWTINDVQQMKKLAAEKIRKSNQMMQEQADKTVKAVQEGSDPRIGGALVEGFEAGANRSARFINTHLKEWWEFAVTFLDRIIGGASRELDQFKEVRVAMAAVGLQASGTCYPDFPLKEIVEGLEGSDAYEQLKELHTSMQLDTKNIGMDALIGPDFYFYNDEDTKHKIIESHIMEAARESVKAAQDARATAEETWVQQGYKDRILGEKKANQIDIDRMNQERDPDFWTAKEGDSARSSVLQAMKGLIGQSKAFHPDDLQGDVPLHCSLADSGESDEGPVQLAAIDEKTDPDNAVATPRGPSTLSPPSNYREVQHRFGADAIDFVAPSTLEPAEEHDPNKTPTFIWPIAGGKSAAYITSKFGIPREVGGGARHDGIDIVNKKDIGTGSYPLHTVATNVIAAADGYIVNLTSAQKDSEGSLKLINAYWRRKGTGDPAAKPALNKKGQPIQSGNWERVLGNKPRETTVKIIVAHNDKWRTLYGHLIWDEPIFQEWRRIWLSIPPGERKNNPKLKVNRGTPLGKIGTSGYSTGPHLHFETQYGKGNYDPAKVCDGEYNKIQGPTQTFDPSSESLLTRCVDQLEKDLSNGQGYTMARAYPTFRLFFIESDLGERKRYGFDDFFAYSSVKEIQVIRSRKVAADLCLLSLTNISGALSNRKFRYDKDPDSPRGPNDEKMQDSSARNPQHRNTMQENPLASMMLQPGVQVQLRLGYNNNPEELEKVFNGVITDVQFSDTDDLVNITCQSFAIELTQTMKGEKKTFGGFLSGSGRTAAILETLIAEPEVVHFGRWTPGDPQQSSLSVLTNRWSFFSNPADDNIFAPTGRGWKGIFDSTDKYVVEETTTWDVFQEMTLRHPGYIACAVPYDGKYGPRMTMFFGAPEQLYFARDPSFKEDDTLDGLKKFIDEAKKKVENTAEELQDADKKLSGEKLERKKKRVNGNAIIEARDFWLNKLQKNYALGKGIVQPFRKYHVVNSTMHILYNSISSSSYNTFNTATINYKNTMNFAEKLANVVSAGAYKYFSGEYNSFTLKCDAALPDEDVVEVFGQYSNCLGYEMAKRYAVGTLFYGLKDGYKGSLVIVGNPSIKPYDICYIFDEYTDMFGPIEVEQVVHRFSQETGFITEITPDMVIHVNKVSCLSTADAMGLMAEHALKRIGLQSLPSVMESGGSLSKAGAAVLKGTGQALSVANTIVNYSFAPLANMFFNSTENTVGADKSTNPGALLGVFIFKKLITRSQLAHPFRYSPLVKSGRVMLGGLPNKKTDGSFTQSIRKWAKDFDEDVPLFLEDTYDRIAPSSWWGHWSGSFGAMVQGEEK